MFNAEQWTEAYLAVCAKNGEDPREGLAFLDAVLPLTGKVSGSVSGTVAANRFAALVKNAVRQTGIPGNRAAQALIWLLVRRGYARKGAGQMMAALSRHIDGRQGVLQVALETASDTVDPSFLRDFEAALIKKHGASSARFTIKTVPELLGGYRWTIGSIRTDCSLAGSLAQLKKTLSASHGDDEARSRYGARLN
jgi:F0F1-type ATP synthase delta subunit